MYPVSFIGVDPGKSGGLIQLLVEFEKDPRGATQPTNPEDVLQRCWYEISMLSMPDQLLEVYQWLQGIKSPRHLFLEKVGGYIGIGQPGSSMFEFGRNFGALEAMIQVAGYVYGDNYFQVTPQKWQARCGILPRMRPSKKFPSMPKETDTQWKNRLKAKAETVFGRYSFTKATSDAALIAYYALHHYVSGVDNA